MSSRASRNRRPRWRAAAALAFGCFAMAALPAATSASIAGSGDVTLAVGGDAKAAKALVRAGVRIVAMAPAKKRGKRVTLPVERIAVGRSATVVLRGAIRFKAGKRTAALRSIRLRLTARRATLSAKTGKRRLAVLTSKLPKGKTSLDRAAVTAKLSGARLALTPKAARLLGARLGVAGISAGALGRLAVTAGPKRSGAGGGTTPGTGRPKASEPPPGAPKSGPIENGPPTLPRPATAVDVSDIAIAWYPRDSWVRYLTTGVTPSTPQNGFFASGGATKGPATTSASHPCSDVSYGGTPSDTFDFTYHYAPQSGWYDPPTGAAAIYGRGSVRFSWQSHDIDLVASDPEIELVPSNPRTIFRFSGSGGTAYPNQRAVLTELDLAGQPVVSGNTRTYTAVRGRLSEDGQAVFAGFYPPPDDGFGCVTVSFTTS
jgi:Htaa